MPDVLRNRRFHILRRSLVLVEDQLDKRGKNHLAQWLRFKQYLWWETCPSDFWKWSQALIETDVKLREIAQREVLLRDHYQLLATHPEANKVELYVYHRELLDLSEQYWRLERIYHTLEASCPSKPARRAYLSVRSKPSWHTFNDWLRRDCANRGGCCGRDCRCCEKPPASNRMMGWGHCTSQRRSCYKERGFAMHTADRDLCQPRLRIGPDESGKWDPYSLALHTTYIWGLDSR